MKSLLFSNDISPACEYCESGKLAADKIMILCKRHGPVSPYYFCKKFVYSPLRRVPKKQPKLPTFTSDDFTL